jgi:hypothetical protein
MAVTSQPTVNGKVEETRRRPSPAMVSRGGVIGAMIFILRVIALVLIVASTFGNYVQFMGGWGAYWPINWTIIGLAALYQLICSLLQWGFKAGKMWLPYGLALLASAIPSFLTYNAWAGPYLSAQVGGVVAGLLILGATIGADALPEWVLVG